MLTEEQVRGQAASWLQEELDLMNDSGKHWIKGTYEDQIDGEMLYCMKGASNALYMEKENKLQDRLRSILDRINPRRVAWEPTEEEQKARAEWETWLDEMGQVRDAAEIALAAAISKVHPLKERVEMLINSDFYYSNQAEELITSYNDYEDTEWTDIRGVHEAAITGLKDASLPITWAGLGEMYAGNEPDEKEMDRLGMEADADSVGKHDPIEGKTGDPIDSETDTA